MVVSDTGDGLDYRVNCPSVPVRGRKLPVGDRCTEHMFTATLKTGTHIQQAGSRLGESDSGFL